MTVSRGATQIALPFPNGPGTAAGATKQRPDRQQASNFSRYRSSQIVFIR
jgi:hypothetical protein